MLNCLKLDAWFDEEISGNVIATNDISSLPVTHFYTYICGNSHVMTCYCILLKISV